ncbi:unnamed protein product [Chrysoparadoxa australica]
MEGLMKATVPELYQFEKRVKKEPIKDGKRVAIGVCVASYSSTPKALRLETGMVSLPPEVLLTARGGYLKIPLSAQKGNERRLPFAWDHSGYISRLFREVWNNGRLLSKLPHQASADGRHLLEEFETKGRGGKLENTRLGLMVGMMWVKQRGSLRQVEAYRLILVKAQRGSALENKAGKGEAGKGKVGKGRARKGKAGAAPHYLEV